jgi:hypothetical protein
MEGHMKLLTQELEDLLSEPQFSRFHADLGIEFKSDLVRFLRCTMDEVRTTLARRIANSILDIIGYKDFGVFRDVVLKRELTGEITYPGQRDHSSHTVYNYLLGWYFFLHSHALRQVLLAQFEKRGVPRPHLDWPFSEPSDFFGCVWMYSSLLHDVGYIFEGGLPALGFRDSSEQAAIGAKVARRYFNRTIWIGYDLELTAAQSELIEEVGPDLKPPRFENMTSLAGIADELRWLGRLSHLSNAIEADCGDVVSRPRLETIFPDSFELWTHHYERFRQRKMARRMKSVRKVFNALIDQGMPRIGIRLLDHGVCSGLLQLLASTYYYRLYAATQAVGPTSSRLSVSRFLSVCSWSPRFWWTGIVWATAATAMHNVQQMSDAMNLDPEWPGTLHLMEEPLAFLGILVDLAEEWDRYSVFKTLDREPTQSCEVELGKERDKVRLRFVGERSRKLAGQLRRELGKSLSGWQKVVRVES